MHLREGLPAVPAYMQSRPVDARGYPVPWFVQWLHGRPDFRIMDARKIPIAVSQRRCWMCGSRLGDSFAFVMGPMCVITMTNAEPPSHLECATFAAKACPFLTLPRAKRRDSNLPGEFCIAGNPIMRNPGVVAIYVTRRYTPFRDGKGGVLFEVGQCDALYFLAEGRAATREEIDISIAGGLPLLEAEAAREGPVAIAALNGRVSETRARLPATVSECPP